MSTDISTLVMQVKSDGITAGATALNKLTTAAEKAETAVKKLGTTAALMGQQIQTGTTHAAALVAAMHALTTSLNSLTTNQTRATVTTRAHNESMREAHALARGLSGSFGALWMTYGNLAGMAVGVGMGAALKGVVAVGSDVEHTLETIRVLGESTTAEVDSMRKAVESLGTATSGPKDVAEALSVLTLAGLNATEALQGVNASLNLSVMGEIGIEKASSTLVQVATALGYTADAFDHISDVIAKTAAVSMSSVDSISGAFKSASSIGELYGASLVDIGVGLAAIANLGIQGTAAGTSLKNMYKDLSSGSEKVTSALASMGMKLSDLKGKDGYFIPLIEMAEKLEKGLSKVKDRQATMGNLQGERGVKEFAALIKLQATASNAFDENGDRYINKLAEIEDRIRKSYAFTAQGAIAMSQTSTNQFKSIGNTMQVTLMKAFEDLQPRVGELARALKTAFSSPEFVNGIKSLATAAADLAIFLAKNASAIGDLIKAFIAFKALQVATTFSAIAIQAVTATTATTGFTLAFNAFKLSLGPVAIAITALATAWYMYKSAKSYALGETGGIENLKEFTEKLGEEDERQRKSLALRRDGLDATKVAAQEAADAQVSALDKVTKASAANLKTLQADWKAREAGLNSIEKSALKRAEENPNGFGNFIGNKLLEQKKQVTQATAEHNRLLAESKKRQESLIAVSKERADLEDAEAKKNAERVTGNNPLNGKPDKGEVGKAYAAAIQKQEQAIADASAKFNDAREAAQLKRRAGDLTEIGMIRAIGEAEKRYIDKKATALQAEVKIAESARNEADKARYTGELGRTKASSKNQEIEEDLKVKEALKDSEDAAMRARIKTLEATGQYEKAAHIKFASEHSSMFQQATEEAIAYGNVYPELWVRVEEFAAKAKAMVAEGSLKDAVNSFNLAAAETSAIIKSMPDAGEGSMARMWTAATRASEDYKASLGKLKAAQAVISSKSSTDKEKTEAQKALATMEALADKHRTKWISIGETIGNSLKKAFGKGGEALGGMVKSYIEYDKLSAKSGEDKVKMYGDMSLAASGFFAEGSKGYKTLQGVSQVFHMAEMAQTLGLINLKAIMAVMNQGGGDPYTAFARMAAMAAVVGALGFAVGGGFRKDGGGGRSAAEQQKIDGTGTVFGDSSAKSESISKSIDRLKDNSSVMLPLTQGMLASLRSIQASMGGLTNLISRTTGLTDGGSFGIQTGVTSKSTGASIASGAAIGAAAGAYFGPVGAAIGAALGGIIGGVKSLWGKTKTDVVDAGLKINGTVSQLQAGKGYDQYASVNTTKSSWFGLSKKTTNSVQTQGLNDELSQQFALIFTSLEDTLKVAATGLGKTSAEVEAAISGLVLSDTVSTKGLEGQALSDALNGFVSKAMDQIADAAFPAMDDFRQVGEGYAETVIRVASGVEQANLAMELLGIKTIGFTEIINKQGDVATEITRQSIFAAEGLNGVTDMLKGMDGSITELVDTYKSLIAIRRQMVGVGLGSNLNVNVVKGAGGMSELGNALSNYQDKYFTKAEKAAIMLKSLTEDFGKLGLVLPANNAAMRELIEKTGTGTAEASKLTGQLLVLADSYATVSDAQSEAKKDLDSFANSIREFSRSLLLGDLSTLKPEEKFAEAKRQYEDTLSKALSGDTVAQGKATSAAQAYLEASRTVNSSSSAYDDSFAQVQKDMSRLEEYAGTQMSVADKQLGALNTQIEGINALNATTDSMLDTLKLIATNWATDYTLPDASVQNGPIPVVSTRIDGADIKEVMVAVHDLISASKEEQAKKMDDLIAVVYDATDKSAEKISQATVEAAETSAWMSNSNPMEER